MKTWLVKTWLVVATFSVALCASATEPTKYDCSGEGFQIHYTTSSFAGAPTFGGVWEGERIQPREVLQQESILGRLVRVDRGPDPKDGNGRAIGLLLPRVHITMGPEIEVDGVLFSIRTQKPLDLMKVPSLVYDAYETKTAHCKAQLVAFFK